MAVPATLVHHVYNHPGDLLPLCGVVPGPGRSDLGEGHLWHTGHDAEMLHAHYDVGHTCRQFCLDFVLAPDE